MRFEEFKGGIRIAISNAELKILDEIRHSDRNSITTEYLDESEVELARKMVSRGLLNRVKMDGLVHYVINNDSWSDK